MINSRLHTWSRKLIDAAIRAVNVEFEEGKRHLKFLLPYWLCKAKSGNVMPSSRLEVWWMHQNITVLLWTVINPYALVNYSLFFNSCPNISSMYVVPAASRMKYLLYSWKGELRAVPESFKLERKNTNQQICEGSGRLDHRLARTTLNRTGSCWQSLVVILSMLIRAEWRCSPCIQGNAWNKTSYEPLWESTSSVCATAPINDTSS